jgi:hypothetical protein
VNDSVSPITNNLPETQWARVCETSEQRGYYAKLERRLICDKSILGMLVNPAGYIELDDCVVCPWEILAKADYIGS